MVIRQHPRHVALYSCNVLLVQPPHARRRTQPCVHHPTRKRRHLSLLHAELVERHRVGPVLIGGREPQRSPACAQAQFLIFTELSTIKQDSLSL
jgi:hypothetical protein